MNTLKARFCLATAVAAMGTFVALAQEPAKTPAAAKPAAATSAKKAAVQKGDDGKQYKPLAEARAKIGEIIADPAKMTETMKELSPEDQKTFVADVNAAIAKLPGSVEDKTAKYLNVNRAAIKGAASGNMANVLAVTFASVPPESLTVLSERYAADLFNRDADPSHKIADPAYEKTAAEVIGKVANETKGSDDAGVRNTLAVLMFVRADNGQIDGLADRLVEAIPDSSTRELAKKEWIPQALASDKEKSYDAMLAYADAGKAPNLEIVLSLSGPQILDAVLVDITSGMNNSMGIQTTPVVDQAFGGFDDASAYIQTAANATSATATQNGGGEVARSPSPLVPWNPDYNRGNVDEEKVDAKIIIEAIKEEQSDPEPEPYPFGTL